ncbi:SLAP domain-containing protein [Companilactobacillus bobalius]|nr:SLAP domain-containing protein [Companilactobacillus bobalius]KAE9561622.1 hypothetical protein ATN92_05980 [Companilactobacillus bobalius]OVE98235.1 putative GPI-anchored adhesin-like protein PGA18 [Companilactobacillus bobalius]
MLLNKKCVYLGASLFSAVTLASLSNQTVKADTTGDNASTTSTTSTTSNKVTSATTEPVSATTSNTTQVAVAHSTTSGIKPASATLVTPKSTTISTVSPTTETNATTSKPVTLTAEASTTVSGSALTSNKATEPATVPTTSKPVTSTSTINLNRGATTTTPVSPMLATKSTTSSSTITPTSASSYTLPNNVSDSTEVNFTDPFLNYMVKSEFGLKSTDPLTVSDVKNFGGNILNLVGDFYYGNMPNTVTNTYVTSFDGMQYLNYLPAGTDVALSVNVSSAPTSNLDLTPMNGLKFESLDLFGNYSDPAYKEISLSQLSKLNISDVDELGLHGTGSIAINDGINNQELKMIAPTLVEIANKGGAIYLGNSSITDFSPLNGIDKTKPAYLNIINNVYDPNPVYAVDKQPISFTAEHVTGLYGTDLSSGYNYSSSVPAEDLDDGDLEHVSGDEYKLVNADSSAKNLVYGYLNDYSKSDSYIHTTYGNVSFIYAGTMARPIIWQAHPTVTLNYENEDGSPIAVNGSDLTKVVDGTTIGDSYDLTADTNLAGYTFVGDPYALKGTYSQDPQVIDLKFRANPVVTPLVNGVTTTAAKPISITRGDVDLNVLAVSNKPVYTYDSTGKPTGKEVILTDTTIKESAEINGDLYYKIGPDEWVLADEFNPYTTDDGIAKTFDESYTPLVDSTGKTIDLTLGPSTFWKYDKVVEIKGNKYYEVGTNNFLAIDKSLPFIPVSDLNLTVKDAAVVYDSKGEKVGKVLPSSSNWRTDGIAVIGGIPMYHVGANEWVDAQSVNTYQPVNFIYHNIYSTYIYNRDGQMTMEMLSPKTSWKVDRIVYINGSRFYRVGVNEYVMDYTTDTSSSMGVFISTPESKVHVAKEAHLYDERGAALTKTVSAGSILSTDGYENIGGQMMYRVGNDEFVSFKDLQSYTVEKNVVSVAVNTPLYDSKGELLDVFLPMNSLWRCDKIVTIGGHRYIRVATDEFIKE